MILSEDLIELFTIIIHKGKMICIYRQQRISGSEKQCFSYQAIEEWNDIIRNYENIEKQLYVTIYVYN